MLLRSPGPISPDTYSGHIRRRALCPNRLRNGMSQRSSSSCQSDILPTMVGPSKSRPPMSHRKTDLGIPCRSKSAKVVLAQDDKRKSEDDGRRDDGAELGKYRPESARSELQRFAPCSPTKIVHVGLHVWRRPAGTAGRRPRLNVVSRCKEIIAR